MRWYCVLCLRASVLKKSTLRLLNAMVTLTPSSLKTRSSGRGRKSGTTLGFPRGSSVYLIFSLIYSPAFPPVGGAKNPNDIVAIGKPDRQDPAFDLAEAVEPLFTRAVGRILGNDADGIGESQLRLGERHAVLCLVLLVLAVVPVEPGLRHGAKTSMNLAEQPYVRMALLRGPLRSPHRLPEHACGVYRLRGAGVESFRDRADPAPAVVSSSDRCPSWDSFGWKGWGLSLDRPSPGRLRSCAIEVVARRVRNSGHLSGIGGAAGLRRCDSAHRLQALDA